MFSGLLQLVNISVHRQIFTSNESKRLFAYAQSFALYHKSLRVGEIFWVYFSRYKPTKMHGTLTISSQASDPNRL